MLDMMAIKAVFVLFCDQLGLVLPEDMAMVKGEEACLRIGSVQLVALDLESIYIEKICLQAKGIRIPVSYSRFGILPISQLYEQTWSVYLSIHNLSCPLGYQQELALALGSQQPHSQTSRTSLQLRRHVLSNISQPLSGR